LRSTRGEKSSFSGHQKEKGKKIREVQGRKREVKEETNQRKKTKLRERKTG